MTAMADFVLRLSIVLTVALVPVLIIGLMEQAWLGLRRVAAWHADRRAARRRRIRYRRRCRMVCGGE